MRTYVVFTSWRFTYTSACRYIYKKYDTIDRVYTLRFHTTYKKYS